MRLKVELTMFVCLCKGIRQSDVRRLVGGRYVDPEMVIEVLDFDDPGNCGRCVREIDAIIEDAGGSPARRGMLARSA